MTPGSGAQYKHFSSKHALLEAGVERFIAEGKAAATELPSPVDVPTEALLTQIGGRAWEALTENEAALRVVWRGEKPGHVSDDRFLAAWAQLASRGLVVGDAPARSSDQQ